jgi:hypothetical protein
VPSHPFLPGFSNFTLSLFCQSRLLDRRPSQELFNQLRQIYRQHNMHEWQDNSLPTLSQPIPVIVCSEALV